MNLILFEHNNKFKILDDIVIIKDLNGYKIADINLDILSSSYGNYIPNEFNYKNNYYMSFEDYAYSIKNIELESVQSGYPDKTRSIIYNNISVIIDTTNFNIIDFTNINKDIKYVFIDFSNYEETPPYPIILHKDMIMDIYYNKYNFLKNKYRYNPTEINRYSYFLNIKKNSNIELENYNIDMSSTNLNYLSDIFTKIDKKAVSFPIFKFTNNNIYYFITLFIYYDKITFYQIDITNITSNNPNFVITYSDYSKIYDIENIELNYNNYNKYKIYSLEETPIKSKILLILGPLFVVFEFNKEIKKYLLDSYILTESTIKLTLNNYQILLDDNYIYILFKNSDNKLDYKKIKHNLNIDNIEKNKINGCLYKDSMSIIPTNIIKDTSEEDIILYYILNKNLKLSLNDLIISNPINDTTKTLKIKKTLNIINYESVIENKDSIDISCLINDSTNVSSKNYLILPIYDANITARITSNLNISILNKNIIVNNNITILNFIDLLLNNYKIFEDVNVYEL